MDFREIDYKTAINFILPIHYAGRKPNIMKSFGYYESGELKAVCTFGKPASNPLCVGVCGEDLSSKVIELNRLVRLDKINIQLSEFVAKSLRSLGDYIVISYSDTQMNHSGYIYQACNFIYTGKTKSRTDKYVPDGKHPRHYKESEQKGLRKVRSSKHRYIYFTGSSKFKRLARKRLNYPILPYPKDKNSNYKLGDYIKPLIINII